jgi:hypothetical protein
MDKNDRPNHYMRPEDGLCALGIGGGLLVTIAASWTSNHDTATALITSGNQALAGFLILWIISKIIRAVIERDD